jgi:hypothetical protein
MDCTLVFPAQPGTIRTPDPSWVGEIEVARSVGFQIAFLSGGVFGEPFRVTPENEALNRQHWSGIKGPALYRGCILKPQEFEQLVELVPGLLTTPENYMWSHDLPRWYADLKELTPRSSIISWKKPPTMEQVAALVEMNFGPKPVMVKDFLKSRKHEWFDACFIRDASDATEVTRVASNFIRLQGDDFYGGLVFREFLNLKQVGIHTKSRMPLVQEFRTFFLRGQPFATYRYWTEGATYIESIDAHPRLPGSKLWGLVWAPPSLPWTLHRMSRGSGG